MNRYYCLYLLLLLIMTVSRSDCMYVKLLPVYIYKLISYTYWVGSSFLATYFSGDRSHWLATLTLSGAVVFIRWVSRDFWGQSFYFWVVNILVFCRDLCLKVVVWFFLRLCTREHVVRVNITFGGIYYLLWHIILYW